MDLDGFGWHWALALALACEGTNCVEGLEEEPGAVDCSAERMSHGSWRGALERGAAADWVSLASPSAPTRFTIKVYGCLSHFRLSSSSFLIPLKH